VYYSREVGLTEEQYLQREDGSRPSIKYALEKL
jgi:hypothetical protein